LIKTCSESKDKNDVLKPKKLKIINPFKDIDIHLMCEQRGDVVLKNILRKIRKFYLH
jgi:hypothetical protein